MNRKLTQFICIKETKLSGKRETIKVGEFFWADVQLWKSNNYVDLWGDPNGDFFTSDRGLGKSNCFIPLYQWRRNQINSILDD
jgi:hypothetical protein